MSLTLPQEDIPQLQDIAANHSDFRTRRAAKAILKLTESEDTKENIAASLGISRSGLYRIEKRYQRYGLEGLILSNKVGRPPTVTEEYRLLLDKTLQTYPRALGLGDELAWTANMLVEYMHEQTNIEISVYAMRDLLHKLGYAYAWQRVVVTIDGRDRRRSVQSWQQTERLEDRYS